MESEKKFWKQNTLTIVAIVLLGYMSYKALKERDSMDPYLLLLFTGAFYLMLAKFFWDNWMGFGRVIVFVSQGILKVVGKLLQPFSYVCGKCKNGADLLTRRMGLDQELKIAEMEKRKKAIELETEKMKVVMESMAQGEIPVEELRKEIAERLHNEELKTEAEQPKQKLGSILEEGTHDIVMDEPKVEAKETVEQPAAEAPKKPVKPEPDYAAYGKLLLVQLNEVNWEYFSIKQAMRLIHKRFGTTKMALDELVNQNQLKCYRLGRRMVYALPDKEEKKVKGGSKEQNSNVEKVIKM